MSSSTHWVYQRMLVQPGGEVAQLADHLKVAGRAFEHIYGFSFDLDEAQVAGQVARVMRGRDGRTSSTVVLRVWPQDTDSVAFTVEYERTLMEAGYSLSALRPRAVTYEYSIPYGAFPTNFQLEAASLFDSIAMRDHGAARSVRKVGDRLLSCGESAIFGIRRKDLVTPALTDGAVDGVERNRMIAAAARSRLHAREEPILHSELKSFDEFFVVDAMGITSLSECDGAKFMSLTVARLLAAIR